MYYIYKLTNEINGKNYIGYAKDYKQRWRQHKKLAQKEKPKHAIHCAIKKYGWDKFDKIILDKHEDKNYTLNVLETKYIIEYNSMTPNGYNMTRGGDGTTGHILTTKQRQLISEKTKEAMARPEIRAKLIGRKASEKTKKILSESHKGYKPTKQQKEKQKIASIENWKNPEIRKKRIEALKIAQSLPKYKEKLKGRIPWNKGMKFKE